MLHLTFNFACSIACLCSHYLSSSHPTCFCTSGSFPLSGVEHKRQLTSALCCGSYPHSEFPLCCRDFPLLEFHVHCFVDGSNPHSEVTVNTTLLQGFSSLGGQKFVCTIDETFPTRKQCHKLSKSLPRQTNHTNDRD